ncbi:MAG TPA: Na+/H+ antiporter NhaA [Gemmatimonadaceae bacterium]|jgi:NhaA family Na+:H+ antiporter|nr:Na+/H+ antiporter NhaA [Gemmatimonadaceae bacterium]
MTASTSTNGRLVPPVDEAVDHILGPTDSEIALVEFGSYDCPYCRAANERIAALRDEFGDQMRYVWRHRPIPGSDLALRAAEVAERAAERGKFWEAHVELMTRSPALTDDDLRAVAARFQIEHEPPSADDAEERRALEHVERDIASARASDVRVTPTFYINGRKYLGLWDSSEFTNALLGTLGHRVREAALDFARWAPSAGILLLLATIISVVLTNSALGPGFQSFWEIPLGLRFGDWSVALPLIRWVNEGLLSIFFLVVGLEIKREFTVGHLSDRRSAALPVAAAIGGMAVPALLYYLVIPSGPWAHGWGVPMATDTAFAVAIIIMMGSRVPVELRIFLTAATIVDDIGAIVVVAFFYSEALQPTYLILAAAIVVVLVVMNRLGVYRVTLYLLLGVVLWAALFAGGLHATLAGVLLALVIPTRDPPNYRALAAQADAILIAESQRSEEVLHRGPSEAAMNALDRIHERLESPADRLLRNVSMRSNYVVLPVFALANAGVVVNVEVLRGHGQLMLAVILGLVVGKPLGMVAASVLAARLGIATKSDTFSWGQVAGAGALSGIGFTMSLFIASEAFPRASDFAATKIAVFAASGLAAAIGSIVLWRTGREVAAPARETEAAREACTVLEEPVAEPA